MKTKLFTLFLALIVGAGTVIAESGKCGNNLTWDFTDGVLTISGTGEMANYDYAYNKWSPWDSYRSLIIEISIGNRVTSIGKDAFRNCVSFTSITIPNSVISIGQGAFFNCTGLTSVTIPNSVISIGDYAFRKCSSLTSVIIPNSVTSIGKDVFGDCSCLTTVNVAADNNAYCSIDDVLFNKARTTLMRYPGGKVGAYIIPNSVVSVGESAFSYCPGLTSIEIPNSVTSIGSCAFQYCTGLTSVTIGNSVTSIGNCAFEYCTGLTSVTIGNSVTSIGGSAFFSCSSLTSITIPNSVTSIGGGAFYGCTGLTSVTIPNSVTSIGSIAFGACSSLTSITIPNSVTSIGEGAFAHCCALNSIFNYAATPQSIDSEVFGGETEEYEGVQYRPVDKSTCKLYVLQESVSKYRAAKGWKEFKNILAIGAEEVEVTTTKATTTSTTATVAWQQITGAASYELIIRDANGNIICTLIFNAQGLLTSITFNAPARGDAPQKTQTAGFAFTITGLESGATYNYTLTAKNEGGTIINTQSGSFITKSPQGIDDVEADSKSTKILRDGQVFIQKGEKTFDIRGQEVK